ncbi:MAG: reprolysin-like metallopeptidase, partial [Planctomycetota bacterium]
MLLSIGGPGIGGSSFDLPDGPDGLWQSVAEIPAPSLSAPVSVEASRFESFTLDADLLRATLSEAPLEHTPEAAESPVTIAVPAPDGGLARFRVEESPVMAPALAAKFPRIKTYRGQGIDDPAATIRFDVTPAGFHAQVLSPSGDYYVDPYWHLDDSLYVSYFKRDCVPDSEAILADDLLEESVSDLAARDALDEGEGVTDDALGATSLLSGHQLRTYRLAVATTAEYTIFHSADPDNPTAAEGLAAIVTAINRVNGIYRRDLSIALELVADNDSIIYTDPSTDPYSNQVTSTQLMFNQSTIDAEIGSANYDVGHLFATGGGGLAYVGVVGSSFHKAKGATGLSSPIGDLFYVDYVSHEMGHQFGAPHTWNGSLGWLTPGQRSFSSAMEPGSGSTIMGYAGIGANDNLQSTSDDYFHSRSIEAITHYVDVTRPTVGTRSDTGNTPPAVDGGPDYTIPARTPFELTATGSDADGDSVTYTWEQRDLGPQLYARAGDDGSVPLFRSWSPTSEPTRTFPRMSDLLNNTTVIGETLATTSRDLNFRVTARDNRSGGGGVAADDVLITVVDTGSPFRVTSPSTAVTWTAQSTEPVTWDVAGTAAGAIGVEDVRILLSTNGGNSFDTVLVTSTPNDGWENVLVPNITTASARIRVEAVGNVFFDVSDSDFTIAASPDTAGPAVTGHSPSEASTDAQSAVRFDFDEPIDTGSFAVVDDIASFTGPTGDLKSELTDYEWIDADTLEVRFNQQSVPGTYSMVIGPNVTDNASSPNAMNQNGDGTNGDDPADQYTAAFQITSPIYATDMDTDPGWAFDPGTAGSKWQWGTPTGDGGTWYGYPDPAAGHTGSNVVGYNLSGDYAADITATQWATTPAIDCSLYENVTLSYDSWLNVRSLVYDDVRVEVSNDGSNWTAVWQNPASNVTAYTWSRETLDISSVADRQATVYIRWGLGPTGNVPYSGWNLDDVLVAGDPLNRPPLLASIGDRTVDEETELTFTASAADPDVPTDTLTYSLDAGAPAGASIDASTGAFTWTPAEAEGPGAYNVTVRVTDDGTPATSDYETIAVTVNEVNRSPVLA